MVPFPVTLNGLNYPLTTPFSTFRIAFYIFIMSGDGDFKFGR